MKTHLTLLMLLAAIALPMLAQEASPAKPDSAPVPETPAPSATTPVAAALPAGYELFEALNDLLTYEAGTAEPLNRALDWFQQAALAKATSATAPGVSGLRQPNHAAAVWSGILFRAAADGVSNEKAIAARLKALGSVLPKDSTPKLTEALNAASKVASEKKPAEVAAFLSAASAAFPEAGRLPLLSMEKATLQQLVKERGYASLGFLHASALPFTAAESAPNGPGPQTAAVLPTAKDYNTFGFDLFRALRAKEQNAAKKDANIVFSPVSIATIMESLWMAAKGPTAAELAAALHLPEDAAIPDATAPPSIAMQLPLGKKENGATLLMSNDLWLKKDWKISEAYEKALKVRLGAGMHSFDRADRAAEIINKHVADNTNGMIKQVVSSGDFGSSSRFVLTNVVYFKAPWETKFDVAKSEPGAFQLSSGSKTKVTFMIADMEAAYSETDCTQVLSLPFAGGAQRLVLLLPAEGSANLEKLEGGLTQETLNASLTALKKTKVKISLPRFNLNAGVSLKDVLPDLNVKAAFAQDTADFSGMSEKAALYISAFRHQAAMEVNEDGAEASAATAAVGSVRSISMTPEFTANRPFVVALLDNSTNTILFLGRVAKPTSPAIDGAKTTTPKTPARKSKK